MAQVFIAVIIVAIVSAIALVARHRRRADAPTQKSWTVPEQIDPHDIFGEDSADVTHDVAEWAIVVFTSATCHVCADVAAKARALESRRVLVREFEYTNDRAMHDKYRIEAVPTLLMCSRAGIVEHSILGPVTATDLWAAVARVRDPDSTPVSGDCADH